MGDKDRDQMLRDMAEHRGFKLVKSRRRKPGGDFGRYGLEANGSGERCLGFDGDSLTATAEEVEDFLRRGSTSTWKYSLGAVKRLPARANEAPARIPKSASRLTRAPAKPKPVETPTLKVREADVVDAEAIENLVSSFAPATAEEIAGRLSRLRHLGEPPLVARLGEEIVGLLTWHVTPVLHRPKPVGRITYLQVEEKMRGKGIGKALVEAVEARLAEKGCGHVEVTSNTRLTRAHGFYRNLGYERTSYRFGKSLEAPKA